MVTGISLLDAGMFDVRDTLIQFKNGEFTCGRGPSQKVDKNRDRILEAADRFGENIVHFSGKQVGLISNLAIISKRIYYILYNILYDYLYYT